MLPTTTTLLLLLLLFDADDDEMTWCSLESTSIAPGDCCLLRLISEAFLLANLNNLSISYLRFVSCLISLHVTIHESSSDLLFVSCSKRSRMREVLAADGEASPLETLEGRDAGLDVEEVLTMMLLLLLFAVEVPCCADEETDVDAPCSIYDGEERSSMTL